MKWLTNEELDAMTGSAAAAQPVATMEMPGNAPAKKASCMNGDMQCIINRHKTASALHTVVLILFILLLLKWLAA